MMMCVRARVRGPVAFLETERSKRGELIGGPAHFHIPHYFGGVEEIGCSGKHNGPHYASNQIEIFDTLTSGALSAHFLLLIGVWRRCSGRYCLMSRPWASATATLAPIVGG